MGESDWGEDRGMRTRARDKNVKLQRNDTQWVCVWWKGSRVKKKKKNPLSLHVELKNLGHPCNGAPWGRQRGEWELAGPKEPRQSGAWGSPTLETRTHTPHTCAAHSACPLAPHLSGAQPSLVHRGRRGWTAAVPSGGGVHLVGIFRGMTAPCIVCY